MKLKSSAGLAVTAALWLSVGCSRQLGMPPTEDQAGKQHLSFAKPSDENGSSPTAALLKTSIPAGTPITVRLSSTLSSARAQAGEPFAAVLEQPVVARDIVIVSRGAAVTGKVVEARAASDQQNAGYLRLTLATVSVQGKTIPLKTSSVFMKGPAVAYATGGKEIELSSARSLTFRLTEVVTLHD